MTILMLGFNASYPTVLERAINDDSVKFTVNNANAYKLLLDDLNTADFLIVNGDDLQRIRQFEKIRTQHDTAAIPAIIAAYDRCENVRCRFSTSFNLTEWHEENTDACFYFQLPLNLEDLSKFFSEPIEIEMTEDRRGQLSTEYFYKKEEFLVGYRHDIGYPHNDQDYFPKDRPKEFRKKRQDFKKWLRQSHVKEILAEIGLLKTPEENDALTRDRQTAEEYLQQIHTELGKRLPSEEQSDETETPPDQSEIQVESPRSTQKEVARRQLSARGQTEPPKRLLIIDDDWASEAFQSRYLAWASEGNWKLIFADFSLQHSENFDLIDLLFYPKNTSIENHEVWEKLKSEKCFLILLDNFYGSRSLGVELGRLFLYACVGRPEYDQLRQKIIAHRKSDKCDEADREPIQFALDTIDQLRKHAQDKNQIFLPKIVLHSDYDHLIALDDQVEFDRQGHLRVPKQRITSDPESTLLFLHATYMMRLGQFANDCYDQNLIGQRDHISDYGEFKGVSKAARQIYRQIRMAREARDATVLIIGESGTGKEVIAQEVAKGRFMVYLRNLIPDERWHHDSLEDLINQNPTRREQIKELFSYYFKAINIGAITTEGNLMETELFGSEKDYPQKGDPEVDSLFEFATPKSARWNRKSENRKYVCQQLGIKETESVYEDEINEVVVFMDELGTAPLKVQIGLLRLLQEKEVSPLPVSSGNKIKVRFKLISATNADLQKAIKEGEFREDLYYRISDFVIRIPKLSERRPDIPILIDEFTKKWVSNLAKDAWKHKVIKQIENAAIRDDEWIEAYLLPKQFVWDDYALLLRYTYPGNVRELEQIVKQSLIGSYFETEDPSFTKIQLTDELRLRIGKAQ